MKHVLTVVLYCGLAGCWAGAQDVSPVDMQNIVAGTHLVFAYEGRESLPSWQIDLGDDRSGSYRELAAGAASQPMHVSEATWKKLQAGTHALRNGRCETKQKGIAQTGKKTLSLANGPALKSCTFNFSDDDALNQAGNTFIALADMMQQGARLQHDLRFARLALDPDIDALMEGVASGRSLEPGNIAPVLQSIVENDRVIDRVRRKAARLLQSAAPAADKPL